MNLAATAYGEQLELVGFIEDEKTRLRCECGWTVEFWSFFISVAMHLFYEHNNAHALGGVHYVISRICPK